jgi:uncharacterized integral membrane protein
MTENRRKITGIFLTLTIGVFAGVGFHSVKPEFWEKEIHQPYPVIFASLAGAAIGGAICAAVIVVLVIYVRRKTSNRGTTHPIRR